MHKKTLTYDLARILLIRLAVFDNDATGCYNRIVVAMGMMVAAQLTMPWNAIWFHASALK